MTAQFAARVQPLAALAVGREHPLSESQMALFEEPDQGFSWHMKSAS
jgi:hypothetical protein